MPRKPKREGVIRYNEAMTNGKTYSETYWQQNANKWAYAYGRPECTGLVKQSPEDFIVIEQMSVEPQGEGEHCWLYVEKRQQNTEKVARALAKFASVKARDVGYSGMKDNQAVTQQWFSVWLPGKVEPDWQRLSLDGVRVLQAKRHHRKIKRGTHQRNQFQLKIRQLGGDVQCLENRLLLLQQRGAPNYFGLQRFGNNFSNLQTAQELLLQGKRINNQNRRGLALSATRSWCFNQILSERINDDSWQLLHEGEPANLDGSSSYFNWKPVSDDDRLDSFDIHPTAPLWGKGEQGDAFPSLYHYEKTKLEPYQGLLMGLEKLGLAYQRRALRIGLHDLTWQVERDVLSLNFSLQRGQFATSVLRECVV